MKRVPNRILLTGASGFLGQAIVKQAASSPEIDLYTTSRRHVHSANHTSRDLCCGTLSDVFAGVRTLIHAAGRAPLRESVGTASAEIESPNTTRRICEAAVSAGVRHIVLVSSGTVYGGRTNNAVSECDYVTPQHTFARAKRDSEIAAIEVASAAGVSLTILRFPTLVGSARHSPALAGTRDGFLRGRTQSGVKPPVSVLHAVDAARACLCVANRPFHERSVRAFNVASSELQECSSRNHQPAAAGQQRAKSLSSLIRLIERDSGHHPNAFRKGKDPVRETTLRDLMTQPRLNGVCFESEFTFETRHTRSQLNAFQTSQTDAAQNASRRSVLIQRFAKRAFDLLVGGAAATLCLPVAATIAATIKLTSPGPILQWSDRLGRDHSVFRMPVFRTTDPETPEISTRPSQNDSYWVTPVGRFLRKTGLDELPRLLSVLQGHMSIVGPRPAHFHEEELIRARSDRGVDRIAPGLTGWQQIQRRSTAGQVASFDISAQVALDECYMQDQCFLLDVRLLIDSLIAALYAPKRPRVTSEPRVPPFSKESIVAPTYAQSAQKVA